LYPIRVKKGIENEDGHEPKSNWHDLRKKVRRECFSAFVRRSHVAEKGDIVKATVNKSFYTH